MPFLVETRITIGMDAPSSWLVKLTRIDADHIHIGLHFGDKESPTHDTVISLGDFKEMVDLLKQEP